MGLFDWLFPKKKYIEPAGKYQGYFKMLDGYKPHFSSFDGSLYESELIRSAINIRATHISKLKVETMGAARPALQRKLAHAPNEYQTWSQFLYRASTLLDAFNTLFIVPVEDRYGEPSGIYTPLPDSCTIVQYDGKPYLRYEFRDHTHAAMELEYCGIMTRFQFRSDFFGESNHVLRPTMDLIHIQNQGIEEGVKSAASYRFIATLNNFSKASDLAAERKRFTAENFARDAEGGGLLLFPNTYTNIQQVKATPFTADADQMKAIRAGVFEYFNVNEAVLCGEAYGDQWAAYYETSIEPFAVQFSEVMTKMLFTLREQSEGNRVIATANRLQYMSNADKLAVSSQLLDRGIMTLNDVREIWQLPPVDGGDVRIMRGEYYNADEKTEVSNNNE